MTPDLLPQSAMIERIDRSVADNHLFTFHLSRPLDISPGQFVELTIPGVGGFPVSTAAWGLGERFQACVRRVGRVTAALYRQPQGTAVGLRGPFGNGFPLAEFFGRDVLLVAGGLGMVPLRGLVQALLARRAAVKSLTLLYGAREPEQILFRRELEELAASGRARVEFTVNFAPELPWRPQASVCRVGLVTELLQGLHFDPHHSVAAVCGPPALYGCVLEELAHNGIAPERIFSSLERRMRCGVGECCHCAVAGVFICREGPVFDLTRLRQMEGAI